MNTYFDYINAIDFAHNCALENQYQYFLKKWPHIFKYVNIHSRLATQRDYYVPVAIANECKIFSVTFNETGCRKVSCFPKTSTLNDCTEMDPTAFISIGDEFYLSCQPACHEISQSVDTIYKDGKCWQMNTEKKIFALFPETIHGAEIFQPLHKGLNLKNGDLMINEDYCIAFGLTFKNGECVAPIDQEIAEFFLGSSVYKSLKKASIQTNLNKVPPSVPDDVKTLNNWLEGSQSIKNNSAYQSKSSMPYISTESASQIFVDFMKDLAIDVSVDFSLDYSIKVMKKRIPKSIIKFSNMAINRKLVQSAIMKTITQSHALTLARTARGLLNTLSKANVILAIFGTISTILDYFDPFNFNYVLDKETLLKVNEHLDFSFYRSNNRNVEITPEKIWNILEDDMSMYIEKLEEKIDYYLNAVKSEDSRHETQRILYKKKKRKTHYNWQKVFHLFFVMILITTSIIFIQYIAFFLLIYLIFILISPPSFY